MIIECPACATRYDIKSELPAEGRSVRCAKCARIWRAMPEKVEDEDDSFTAFDDASESPDRDAFAKGAADDEPWRGQDQDEWQREPPSGVSDAKISQGGHEPRSEPQLNEDEPLENDAGKESWFSAFTRNRMKQKSEETEKPLGHDPAEAIPFPSPNKLDKLADHSLDETPSDDVRKAVQDVFSRVSHDAASMMDDEGTNAHAYNVQRGMAPPNQQIRPQALERGSGLGGQWPAKEKDFTFPSEKQLPNESNRDPAGEEDPDAVLREALRSHFLSAANGMQSASSRVAPAPVRPTEAQLGSDALLTPTKTVLPNPPRAVEPPAFEADPDGGEEANGIENDETGFDRRLYREIEEAQDNFGNARVHHGGLALAAAWGLFICVASGLMVGFFAFQDTIADSAPGLAPLYRALGMPVTVQPLSFESVHYEWSSSDNKPVLVVSGSVINHAQRKVKVPQFFITVKNDDASQDRIYSANLKVNGTHIGSNEAADFNIQLVSPDPTISAIELELRNIH